MKTNYIHKSKYFYGNEISKYGLDNGYIDYRTLAKAFDCVLANDITLLFFNTVNNEYLEPQLINGLIDNTEEIERLEAEKEQFEEIIEITDNIEYDDEESYESITIRELAFDRLATIDEKIAELEDEENQEPEAEIFQYYIISQDGAEILQELTNEIVYYIEPLNLHIWGVTHYGTSWDYVLTDISIRLED